MGNRSRWQWIGLLACWLLAGAVAFAGQAGQPQRRSVQAEDPCERRYRVGATQLRRSLDFRLMHDFPVAEQLDEGHGRLAPASILILDCDQRRVVISTAYEFRGHIGVMDLTRRGTLVLQLRLSSPPGAPHILLEEPRVQDITFDNPAPWFDGKAIATWALTLFATPKCAVMPDGRPC